MKRRRVILVIGVSPVVGALLTLVTAWGLAVRGVPSPAFPQRYTGMLELNGRAFVFMHANTGRGWVFFQTSRVSSVTVLEDRLVFRPSVMYDWGNQVERTSDVPDGRHLGGSSWDIRAEYHFGWPLVAMWGAADVHRSGAFETIRTLMLEKNGKYSYWRPPGRERVDGIGVPTGILRVGFAVDTAFFAAAWVAVALGFVGVRRLIRRRRGRCGSCGYDLRGLPAGAVCPECGRGSTNR